MMQRVSGKRLAAESRPSGRARLFDADHTLGGHVGLVEHVCASARGTDEVTDERGREVRKYVGRSSVKAQGYHDDGRYSELPQSTHHPGRFCVPIGGLATPLRQEVLHRTWVLSEYGTAEHRAHLSLTSVGVIHREDTVRRQCLCLALLELTGIDSSA